MKAPRVSVLIVSRRRPERLRGCLRSVASQAFEDREVIVLANGCSETAAIVEAEFPGVRLVVEATNLGSAPGRNRVVREARGEFLLFLDDDGEIRAKDVLERLVEALDERPRVGVASMALYDAEVDEPTGWRLRTAALDYACFHASFAGGACLVRADAFRESGAYCELFTGPGEEFDLAVRMYGAGWPILHFPEVAFHHHVDKSESDWMHLVAAGYAHLQLTIWRLYPAPWHVLASAKALLAAIYVDLRLYGGRLLLYDVREGWRNARVGMRERRPVSRAALADLYAAKYYRVGSPETLARARRGVLLRLPWLRLRRKLRGVAKLPAPEQRRTSSTP